MSRKKFRHLSIFVIIIASLGVAVPAWQHYLANTYSSDGLWRGTFDINGRGPFNLTALYVGEEVVAISEDARVLYRGMVGLDGSNYQSSMDMFFMNANPFGKVELKGHMPASGEIVAHFKTLDVGDEGELRMQMNQETYHRSSSFEHIKGRWVLYRGYEITQINIDENGNIQGGNTAACEHSGQVGIIDEQYNAYQIKLAISSCNDRDGYLEGLAYLGSSVEADDTLHIYAFSDDWGLYMPIVRNDDSRNIDKREKPTLES